MANYKYISETGTIVPDTQNILKDVNQEWQNVFGSQLSLDASTVQGRIMELITAERKATVGNCAQIANMINPNKAVGVFLDAIAGLFGVSRLNGKHTQAVCTLGGKPLTLSTASIEFSENATENSVLTVNNLSFTMGTDITIGATASDTASNVATKINGTAALYAIMTATANDTTVNIVGKEKGNEYRITVGYSVGSTEETSSITTTYSYGDCTISAGSQAKTQSGEIYVLSTTTTLDETGTAQAIFVAQNAGAIILGANELNQIGTPTYGWETITNPSVGTTGYDNQSDFDFRYALQQTRYFYSTSMINSLYGALYQIEGLQSAYIIENTTSNAQTNTDRGIIPVGETVLPHSVMIIVYGGNSSGTFETDVAKAIFNKRSGGCGMSPVADASYVKRITFMDTADVDSVYAGRISTPYTMTFNMAKEIPVYISVNVENIDFGGQVDVAVKEVLMNWFAGNLETADAVNIGHNISAFEIGNIIMQNVSVKVKDCRIGLSPNPTSTAEIPIEITQIATLPKENITVVLES